MKSNARTLNIRLFGQFDISLGEESLGSGITAKPRELLAYLILKGERGVRNEDASSELWDTANHKGAMAAALTRLRRELGGEQWRIPKKRETLKFDFMNAIVDVIEFDKAITASRKESNKEKKYESLKIAIQQYRGKFLEGVDSDWAANEQNQRELEALEALSTLAKGGFTPQEVVEQCRIFIEIGLGEEVYALKMSAYGDLGDFVSVDRTFEQCKDYSRRVLKDEPSERIANLYNKIRSSRPPVPVVPESHIPAIKLPPSQTPLIGRTDDIAAITALVTQNRLVTLTGAGGVGKTRLAVAVVEANVGRYRDGAFFLDMAPLTSPTLAPPTVAEALSLREESGKSISLTVCDRLQSKHILLLMDNCEHLLPEISEFFESLLQSCPQLTILATSREHMNIASESIYDVPPLATPNPNRETEVGQIALYSSVQLFVQRASLKRADFDIMPQNAADLSHICSRLDGIPLAIELAAARITALSVQDINRLLDDRFKLLARGPSSAPLRQQTMRASLDWSYELLAAPERVMFGRLSIFTGGWTLQAAEEICSGQDVAREAILDLLTGLAEKSLVSVRTEKNGQTRYRFLETVRQFAAEKLQENGRDLAAVRERHLDYFTVFAEEAEAKLNGPEQTIWLEQLEREHDNFRTALGDSDSEKALRLAGALGWFWYVRGYLREGRSHLTRFLEATAHQGHTKARVTALNAAGNLARLQNDYNAARGRYEEALAISRELKDNSRIIRLLNNLGVLAYDQGEYETARQLYRENLTLSRELKADKNIAHAVQNLGVLAFSQGDFRAAQGWYEEGLAIYQKLEDKWGIANMVVNLGSAAHSQQEYEKAYSLYERGLFLHRELDDKYGIAASVSNLGSVAYNQHDYEKARMHYTDSLRLMQELGEMSGVAISLEAFAALAVVEGRMTRAATLWGAAEALRERISSPIQPADRGEYDDRVTGARVAAGETAFNAAWMTGKTLSPDEAISAALEPTLATDPV